jgi:hypothetical protein
MALRKQIDTIIARCLDNILDICKMTIEDTAHLFVVVVFLKRKGHHRWGVYVFGHFKKRDIGLEAQLLHQVCAYGCKDIEHFGIGERHSHMYDITWNDDFVSTS